MFSNTLPPPGNWICTSSLTDFTWFLKNDFFLKKVVAGASKALDLIMKDTSLPKKLHENTMRFRNKMTKLGFTISGDDHAISPVMLGDAK